jgi:hypothetical protein
MPARQSSLIWPVAGGWCALRCIACRHVQSEDTQFAAPLQNFVTAADDYTRAHSVAPESIAAEIADACTHTVRGVKLRPNMSWSMTALKYLPQPVMDYVVRHLLARQQPGRL